ncbi:oxidoreductase/nitrogenase, component 1 [Azotobacter vinelandii CA]|uniref:nitrogenase n=2 Tax=Azotobacter vinelandii TaxID=354 RepID=C1DE18_AZOVD|nr:nitrogenase component 1 [Azotobacter vinelandii]ACO80126.1 oxidoreductase/nitrogenase, component 1 [Azotobacter vinelandii DJ]AGK16103.1 oxidoreductase/nitrogenase, component 1 [Azotobacter vinelandii CA]AGK21714.1 oxidoreductase/nitrogenase, component 1 [Azotobacter vinelandii CA6]WKN20944.1 oxidoreductase [Azotobacter vinelandii]SFX20220.1 nitrogenase molybdenum-iron protein alpha chain [Azotobacter vinelandii]
MNDTLPPKEKLHRQGTRYPPLAAGCPPFDLPPWNRGLNRMQTGRQAIGHCLYGGQTATLWAPVRDLLHITHGPVGCGVYAQANRPATPGPEGLGRFSGLNLCTDFLERDVVFGGEPKLALAIREAARLFPLQRGMTLLSTCPVALIGDDIGSVARRQQERLGTPVVAVHCAGFRRGEGIGDTHATIADTWRDWARPSAAPAARAVTLFCREMDGAWRGIVRLLESIGLDVVARWPGGGSRRSIARLGDSRLVVGIDMEYWVKLLCRRTGQPWLEADFLGPGASAASLRAIAAHFDDGVRAAAEALIASQAGEARARLDACRERLAGRLYLSLAPVRPRDAQAFAEAGIRVGSALQGWPEADGRWRLPERPLRYQEMSPEQVDALLARARPDLLDGLGQDGPLWRRRGYAVLDDQARAELNRTAIGFAGTERLARLLQRLFDSPLRKCIPPWGESGSRPAGPNDP